MLGGQRFAESVVVCIFAVECVYTSVLSGTYFDSGRSGSLECYSSCEWGLLVQTFPVYWNGTALPLAENVAS